MIHQWHVNWEHCKSAMSGKQEEEEEEEEVRHVNGDGREQAQGIGINVQ